MEIGKSFEKISLPVEGLLLEMVGRDLEVGRLDNTKNIVLVGTDKNFTLAKGLRDIFPEAGITVIDRNKGVKKWAGKSIEENDAINVRIGEVGGEGLGDIKEVDLLIAKHLIHFIKKSEERVNLLGKMGEMVGGGGAMMLSVPAIMEKKVIGEINDFGWSNQRIEIGSGFGGSVVWKMTKHKMVE